MASNGAKQVPTKEDVDYVLVDFEPLHKQRWRSDTVRFVCVEFPPHTKSLWHQHLNYGIYIVMAPLNVTEQPIGHQSRPLVKDKGSVFCRDHTKDKLLHAITSHDTPLFIVEVELLKKKEDILANSQVALHGGQGVELLNDEPECRVYRLTIMQNDPQSTNEISLNLPTGAVLVVLDDCEVEVTNASENPDDDVERNLSLKVADDVQLTAGKFNIKLLSPSTKKTQFILAEVY